MQILFFPIILLLLVLHGVLILIAHIIRLKEFKKKQWNHLVALDRYANSLLGGNPNETISSRLGRERKKCKFCRFVCRFLHFFDQDHCDKSIGT